MSLMMLEKERLLRLCIILGYFISVCSLTAASNSSTVDQCSKWNISSRNIIFGLANGTAGKDADALDLLYSDLKYNSQTDEFAILDDNNHRVLVFNRLNASTLFAILSDSSNLTNRSMISYSPSAISYNGNSSLYILDNWNKQFIQMKNPLDYGENATLTNRSIIPFNPPVFNGTAVGLWVDNADGNIYISDDLYPRIIRYDINTLSFFLIGSGTAGNTSNLLNSPTSIVMDSNRTLFVNDVGNNRIQMFRFNSSNGTTLPTTINGSIGLNLYSSEILVINTKHAVYLFNLTNNETRCVIGCTNSTQLNDIHNAVIDNDGNLIVTDSNQLVSYPIYQECTEITTTSTTTTTSTSTTSSSTTTTTASTTSSTTTTTTTTSTTSSSTTTTTTSTTSSTTATTTTSTTESTTTTTTAATTESTTITTTTSNSFMPGNNCSPGKLGINCSINDNICDLNQPCLNSGSCTINNTNSNGYDCQCLGGFQGINCEVDQQPCQPYTCFKHGTCSNTSSTTFTCHCDHGYEGNNCERIVDFCANVTCQNRGVCSRQFLNFTCNCLAGSYGRYCETIETSNVVRTYVRKGFGYIAILMLGIVIGFIVVMDILKYGFGIDPVKADRDAVRKKQMKNKKKKVEGPKIAYRFQYIS